MVTGSRLRQFGWAVTLALCFTAFFALTFKVNSVKSQVRLAERHIVSLEGQNQMLQTEFETRSSQQQLAQWNAVDFGYKPPTADQYLEGERQLAALGEVRRPDAPAPIRVARADETGDQGAFRQMVSPLTGKPVHSRIETGAIAAALVHGGEILADTAR